MSRKQINVNCLYCKKEFTANLSDRNRGHAKFCSKSCSCSYQNENRKLIEKKCEVCGKAFKTKCSHAKHCSRSCGNRKSKVKIKAARSQGKYRYHLSAEIYKEFGDLKCFYCGWDKDKCDIHHIKARVNGGTDEYNNLTIACPNCHRLIHKGKLKVGLTLESYKNEYKCILI